jgi:hypothetical protein
MFFFFQNYLLFNYIITKIVDRKIEYQLNNEIFLDNDNLIENKMKQMVKKKFSINSIYKDKIEIN